MKKIPILILILALVFSLAACSGRSPEEENLYTKLKPVTLICADSTSQGSAGQLFGQYFAQRVSEITDSKLTIDYRPNGELGGDLALLRKMQADELQMVVCQTAPMVSFVQEMAVFDLPMVFSGYDGDRIDDVLNGENPFSAKLAEASENAGIQLLGFLQDGTYRLTTSNRSLTTLEDFQGLHIRTMENENHMAFWTALGADPVPLPWEEVYSALLKGSIDAQENAADTCYSASLQNVQKYLACTDHILYCNLLSMNKRTWDALDPAYQAAIRQAASEAIAYMRPILAEVDAYHQQKLMESGMERIEYDASFTESILSLEGVRALYEDIDKNQTGGLGTLLQTELSK